MDYVFMQTKLEDTKNISTKNIYRAIKQHKYSLPAKQAIHSAANVTLLY